MAGRFNKLRLKEKDLDGSKGIVYIGHLPKGFEEEELKKFFVQVKVLNIDKLSFILNDLVQNCQNGKLGKKNKK